MRGSGRDGIRELLAVIEGVELTREGHSFLEREFLRIVHAGGLPRPTPQVVLTRRGTRLVRVDFHFPGTPVVVEVLGYRFHATREHLSSDAARLNRLVLDGFIPLQFTYDTVMTDASAMLTEIRKALTGSSASFMSRA